MNTHDRRSELERTVRAASTRKLQLRLFVAGMTPRSTQAITDLRRLSADLRGHECSVEVIDIYENPAAAAEAQVVAVPTLVRDHPLPQRRLTGSLGNLDKVARALGIYRQESFQT